MIGAILLFAQLQGSLQAGVAVHPDTVTVGEHFTAVARVRAPGHVTIRFPSAPDSGSAIDTAGASTQHDESTAHVSDVSITYVLAAWDTGTVRLQLGDAIIEDGNITRRAPLNSASIYVKSVLPKDTSLRKPKSARPPIEVRPFDWRPWIYAALALLAALLAFFLWRWWRRRRDRPIPPLTWAEREFRRVEALGLLEKGERERYAVLMADVMREYLARRRLRSNVPPRRRKSPPRSREIQWFRATGSCACCNRSTS